MAQSKHPLFPEGRIGDQVADLNTKKNYLNTNSSRLGIPEAELTVIKTQVTAVNTAQAAVDDRDRRTRLDTARRNLALHTAQTTLRKVIDYYVARNPNATAVDFEALRVPRMGPSPLLPPPDCAPGMRRLYSENLAVIALIFDIETGRRAKPPGTHAIEVCYQLGGEPPADIAAMTGRMTATRSPVRIRFDFADEFKTIYIAFRWVGNRGDYGPWSEIHKVVIAR
jgi:hypothetical protein